MDILNGTYPPDRRFLIDEQHSSLKGSEDEIDNDDMTQYGRGRHLRKLHNKADEEAGKPLESNPMEPPMRLRKLFYYTDDIPVTINSVTDNPLCAGSAQNNQVMCAIVSSTVCVVLEEGDDPDEVRALMIAGLRQAVDSGDFLRRIPPEDLTMMTP